MRMRDRVVINLAGEKKALQGLKPVGRALVIARVYTDLRKSLKDSIREADVGEWDSVPGIYDQVVPLEVEPQDYYIYMYMRGDGVFYSGGLLKDCGDNKFPPADPRHLAALMKKHPNLSEVARDAFCDRYTTYGGAGVVSPIPYKYHYDNREGFFMAEWSRKHTSCRIREHAEPCHRPWAVGFARPCNKILRDILRVSSADL